MNMRFATEEEVNNWNDIIMQNPDGGNILQGEVFLAQKKRAGWTPRYILSDTCAIAIMEKYVPLLGKIWYCPKGPGVANVKQLEEILSELRPFAKTHGVFTIKIEPELDYTETLFGLDLIKTHRIQPNSTVLVDLSPSLDDIMKSLNQKGRHAIRRAERDGVTVKQVELTDESINTMYELFKATAEGAGFVIRSKDYYKHFYLDYGDDGGLFFAYVDDTPVAGAFAMVQGEKSIYKDGASVRERPVYGASHLLQWEVMKWAKVKGSKIHDLAGVPPIAEIKNADHPFYGLGRFKTSFNKTVTEYVGAYEVPIRPLKTKLWMKLVERVVRRLHYTRHHDSYY